MNMRRKKILVITSLLIIFFTVFVGTIWTATISQKEATIMERKMAYAQINYAFLLVDNRFRTNEGIDIEMNGMYRPLPAVSLEENSFGIIANIYILLLMYEIATERVLSYETVMDYFSQEYEPDGSLRQHNNGKHPETHDFVEWMWEGSRWWSEFGEFISGINLTLHNYYLANENSGFIAPPIYALSPQMLSELARTHSDPERFVSDMNLIELQNAGY